MLGQLYHPRGLALETAKAVLEVENPMACNVAKGCPNACLYCYGPKAFFQKDWTNVRYPKEHPITLVRRQLDKGSKPEGVFLSFATDPFHYSADHDLASRSRNLIEFLNSHGIHTASLTKLLSPNLCDNDKNRFGITMVSSDESFWKRWEPNTRRPDVRLRDVWLHSLDGDYTWGSIEPLPVPAIHKQDFKALLESFAFMHFLILGKWNYNKLANTVEAKEYYAEAIWDFRDFCGSNAIRWHVKSESLRFCNLDRYPHFKGHGGYEKRSRELTLSRGGVGSEHDTR